MRISKEEAAREHRINARKEKIWKQEACKDAKYNANAAVREMAAGHPIEAKFSQTEAKNAMYWCRNVRPKILKREERMGKY